MEHFVIVDFEANCDEPRNPEPQEMLEFPAVVVAPDGTIGARFHSYVQPTHHALTPFCTRLTGITPDDVRTAPTFPEVLTHFEAWVAEHVPSPWLLVTCGDWDFASLFPKQCAAMGVAVPIWARRWYNLKHAFRTRHINMMQMLAEVGLEPLGRWHCGRDDADNIARVVQRLLTRGTTLQQPTPWRCPACGVDNAPAVTHCVKCSSPPTRMLPGDWQCPRCSCVNFAKRRRCYDCDASRD